MVIMVMCVSVFVSLRYVALDSKSTKIKKNLFHRVMHDTKRITNV